ncbi:MAG: hypothetical protein PHH36_01055 [Sideroxydans sp.]|nr:hypothetical protein [Sideroxydans sp.]
MRRFYTGLLFFGASFGAHAAETHKHSHAAKHAPVAMHYTQYVPEAHTHNSVVYSDFQTRGTGVLAPQLAASAGSTATLTQGQKNLVNVLNALFQKKMVLQNEKMQLSLQPGTAVMESGHLKVAVQSDATLISWHKSF